MKVSEGSSPCINEVLVLGTEHDVIHLDGFTCMTKYQ
jgi:hypothetical protein